MTTTGTTTGRETGDEVVLGVRFFIGTLEAACERIAGGGLLTAPSAPGLGDDLIREPAYRQALEERNHARPTGDAGDAAAG